MHIRKAVATLSGNWLGFFPHDKPHLLSLPVFFFLKRAIAVSFILDLPISTPPFGLLGMFAKRFDDLRGRPNVQLRLRGSPTLYVPRPRNSYARRWIRLNVTSIDPDAQAMASFFAPTVTIFNSHFSRPA